MAGCRLQMRGSLCQRAFEEKVIYILIYFDILLKAIDHRPSPLHIPVILRYIFSTYDIAILTFLTHNPPPSHPPLSPPVVQVIPSAGLDELELASSVRASANAVIRFEKARACVYGSWGGMSGSTSSGRCRDAALTT